MNTSSLLKDQISRSKLQQLNSLLSDCTLTCRCVDIVIDRNWLMNIKMFYSLYKSKSSWTSSSSIFSSIIASASTFRFPIRSSNPIFHHILHHIKLSGVTCSTYQILTFGAITGKVSLFLTIKAPFRSIIKVSASTIISESSSITSIVTITTSWNKLNFNLFTKSIIAIHTKIRIFIE